MNLVRLQLLMVPVHILTFLSFPILQRTGFQGQESSEQGLLVASRSGQSLRGVCICVTYDDISISTRKKSQQLFFSNKASGLNLQLKSLSPRSFYLLALKGLCCGSLNFPQVGTSHILSSSPKIAHLTLKFPVHLSCFLALVQLATISAWTIAGSDWLHSHE